ncbi:MAG: hypothetical protein M1347_00965 [Chloroflexi bacterium]|nr:hypothetical protein [Chloroflexota bacterium]
MSSSGDFTSLVDRFFGPKKFPKNGFNAKEFRDELLFVSKVCKKVENHEIELLISLQNGLRAKWWTKENPLMTLIEAIGYLGQKFDHVTAHIFKRITGEVGTDAEGLKYFLAFCLTVAAKINPLGANYLIELWSSSMSKAEQLGYDLKPWRKDHNIKNTSGKQLKDLSSADLIRGLADSYELFGFASKSVIDHFFERLINLGHVAPQFVSFYMNKVLGEKPLVITRELREDGEYEFNSKDYTDLALLFLTKSFAVTRAVNSEEFANLGWLIRWCLNDQSFKQLVKETIMGEEMGVGLLRDSLRYDLQNDLVRKNRELRIALESSIERLVSEDKESRLAEHERLSQIARSTNFGSSHSHLNPEFTDWIRFELLQAIDGSSKYSSY